MISLRCLNKLINVDKQRKTVKAEAGILMSDLNDILAANDLSLTIQGGVSDVTLAGVISTGTHGSSIKYGSMSTHVVEMELMCASGEVISVSRDRDEDTFRAAAVGLGALGVIITVTMQCEPMYRLEEVRYPVKTEALLENLDDYLHGSDYLMFQWYPYTDGFGAQQIKRTSKLTEVPETGFFSLFVGHYMLIFLIWICPFLAFLVPYMSRFYYKYFYSKPSRRVERCDRIQNYFSHMPNLPLHCMEWAIPRNKAALVLRDIDTWIKNSKFPALFPIDVRFVQKDDLFLSPAYGHDVCCINITMFKTIGKISYKTFYKAVTDIMVKVNGRPHWAKEHNLTSDYFKKTYPKWDDFCRVRKRLDPQGMFLNRNLEQVFGIKLS